MKYLKSLSCKINSILKVVNCKQTPPPDKVYFYCGQLLIIISNNKSSQLKSAYSLLSASHIPSSLVLTILSIVFY
jgi:hypothetical protein